MQLTGDWTKVTQTVRPVNATFTVACHACRCDTASRNEEPH